MIRKETKFAGLISGAALATLTPWSADFIQAIAQVKVPEGWATIFAALIGLAGGSLWGYHNMIRSNEDNQKRLSLLEDVKRDQAKRLLAASLYGEIRAYITSCDNFITYAHHPSSSVTTDNIQLQPYPAMEFNVFRATAGQVGLLGEALAATVTYNFAQLTEWAMSPPLSIPRNQAAATLAPQIETIEKALPLVAYLGHQLAVLSGAQSEVIPLPAFENLWNLGRKNGTPATVLFAVRADAIGPNSGTV